MARRKEPAPVCCSHWRVVTSGQLQMVASRSRVSGSIRRRGFFMFQLAARCRAALPVRLDAHRPGSVVYVVVRLKNVQTCQRSCGRQLLHTNPNSCACIGPCGESPGPAGRAAPAVAIGASRTAREGADQAPEQWCGVTHVADAGRLLAFEDVLAKFGQSMPLRASHADTSFKSPHRNSGGTGRVAWSVTNLSCARRPQTRLICELRGEGSDDGHQLANKEKVMVGFFEPHGHAPRTSLRY